MILFAIQLVSTCVQSRAAALLSTVVMIGWLILSYWFPSDLSGDSVEHGHIVGHQVTPFHWIG